MKINEKHLIFFSTPKGPVANKNGYLEKRGEINKAFQKRWFVLKGNLLFYFEKQSDFEPIGVIILEGCSVKNIENSEKFCFELSFVAQGSRTYIFAADSQNDLEEWMRAIASSTYDYMKASILHFQYKIEEITKAKQNKMPSSPIIESEEIVPSTDCSCRDCRDFDALHREYGKQIYSRIGRSVKFSPIDDKLIDI